MEEPGAEARDRGLHDYLHDGILAAVYAAQAHCDGANIHVAGYCLGGTLLAMCAAKLARDADGEPLATITLFATETDFSEPGELGLFIDKSAVDTLDALMWSQGYLDGPQMTSAFQARPRIAVALGLQASSARTDGPDVRAHVGGPQRGHRFRTRPSAAAVPDHDAPARRAVPQSGTVPCRGRAPRWLVVARMEQLACPCVVRAVPRPRSGPACPVQCPGRVCARALTASASG